ncbi:MAG: magnesium transporter MgtC [Alphaproteobacteria bacterium]|nr:magnesium transporter MgtC [Alphaproteobacteria bacterium]
MFELDWALEFSMTGRLLFAGFLGALIGLERELHKNSAGIRTYAAISMGACTFGLVSMHVDAPDPTRIAAQVVSGIGFIGAGIIFKSEDKISGLTTAATIWATAAVVLAVAFKMLLLPVLSAVLLFGLLALHHLPILSQKE